MLSWPIQKRSKLSRVRLHTIRRSRSIAATSRREASRQLKLSRTLNGNLQMLQIHKSLHSHWTLPLQRLRQGKMLKIIKLLRLIFLQHSPLLSSNSTLVSQKVKTFKMSVFSLLMALKVGSEESRKSLKKRRISCRLQTSQQIIHRRDRRYSHMSCNQMAQSVIILMVLLFNNYLLWLQFTTKVCKRATSRLTKELDQGQTSCN